MIKKLLYIEFLYPVLFVALFCWLMLITGCKSPDFGCSNRKDRRAVKALQKGYRLCPSAIARETAVLFPIHESDTSWKEYKEGETVLVRDTIVETDTVHHNDTTVITKTAYRYLKRVDTLYINHYETKVDTRQIEALQSKISKAENLASEKQGKIKTLTIICVVLGSIILLALAVGWHTLRRI